MKNNELVTTTDPRFREQGGWRTGRPVEDPDKMKRWGFVTAKPSEHLIHVRGGKVTTRSGQGATCFKWPWDSVAIVPTSLQRLQFRADQVTAEKVGVEVVGFAVYRIADPVLAFRVLNFSFPERAQEKLEETLTSMFVGATRRIVATLEVEDCLKKRKSALAEELLREISPVVGGQGRYDDVTYRGWGVVIDTIEIQEVRVLSGTVFAAMQAPFRADLEQRARVAKAVAEQTIAERESRCRRETELARLEVETELATRSAEIRRETVEADARDAQREAALKAEAARALVADQRATEASRIEAEAMLASKRAEVERAHAEELGARAIAAIELEAHQAGVVSESFAARADAQAKLAELERLAAALRAEVGRMDVETEQLQGRARAVVALEHAEAAVRQADADARIELARQLPLLAAALGERMGEVNITHVGGDANPFSQLTAGLMAIVDVAKRA